MAISAIDRDTEISYVRRERDWLARAAGGRPRRPRRAAAADAAAGPASGTPATGTAPTATAGHGSGGGHGGHAHAK